MERVVATMFCFSHSVGVKRGEWKGIGVARLALDFVAILQFRILLCCNFIGWFYGQVVALNNKQKQHYYSKIKKYYAFGYLRETNIEEAKSNIDENVQANTLCKMDLWMMVTNWPSLL